MQVQINISRYDPQKNKKPYIQSFSINKEELPGVMLLDALIYIKDNLDTSLSFRRSCQEGVCGSDGMNINGSNGLACVTPLANLPDNITLRPLPGMPIIRDLIVDLSNFFKQYEKVKPFLQNKGPVPSKEYLQSPEEREKLDGLYECILCACCTSSCPSYWWNPDKFVGPQAGLQAARFILDSRDDATSERLKNLQDHYEIFRCRSIYNCANSCPKGLNPGKAIADIRHTMLKDSDP